MSYRKNWPTWLAYIASMVIFLSIAAYAVMYSTGYRIDFKDLTLIKTGVLAVTTKPAGATATLNERKLTRATPLTLRNLLPGEYKLTLALEGYRPFEYTVTVESGKVTEVHNLELVLNDVKQTELATQTKSVVNHAMTIIYLANDGQIMKLSDGTSTPFDISKLSEITKTQLKTTTGINFAKRYADSNTWALGLQMGNRKTVAIIDEGGYRGQFLTAPLINVDVDDLMWIDADRLLLSVAGTIYTRDLTLNRTNTYAKDVLGTMYSGGKLSYVTKDKTGQTSLLRDANVFDDKVADIYIANVPVAKSYQMVAIENQILFVADNAGVKGLWLTKTLTNAPETEFTKLVTNLIDWANDAKYIYYTSGRELFRYRLDTATEETLRSFPRSPEILDMVGESLYIRQDNRLVVVDKLGQNAYPVMDILPDTKWLASDGRRAWVSAAGKIVELTLRTNTPGLFSGLVGRIL